jgi:cell division septal protein FtsQ
LFFIKKNNLILLGTGNVKKILTRRFPLIKDVVQTKRIWPNQLVIEVKERIPGFVIESDGKYFLIDEDGVVFDQIMDPGEMLIVKDQEVEDFARGESLGNTRLAGFVLALSRQWDSKINTPIASIIFGGKNTPDVQVETLEGWSVMFDTQRPVVVQLNNLAVLLNKTITEQDRTHLAYIDLRLETKVFICYKEKPCGSPPQADPEIPPTTP